MKIEETLKSHLHQLARNNSPVLMTLITHPYSTFISSLNIFKVIVHSTEINKKNIVEYLRRAIRIKIKEFKRVYEGEVVSFSLYDKKFTFTLKSGKGSITVQLSSKMYEMVKNEQISIGDVVYIEPLINAIKKLGRSENAFEYDIEKGKKVGLPKEEVLKNKIVLQNITLYDLDKSNYSNEECVNYQECDNNYYNGIMNETDDLVNKYVNKNLGEVEIGILHIKDIHLLNTEILQQIVSLSENNKYSPIVVMSTDSRKYLLEMEEILGDAVVVELDSIDEYVSKMEKNVKNIIGKKGNEECASLMGIGKEVSEDDLKSIVEGCYYD